MRQLGMIGSGARQPDGNWLTGARCLSSRSISSHIMSAEFLNVIIFITWLSVKDNSKILSKMTAFSTSVCICTIHDPWFSNVPFTTFVTVLFYSKSIKTSRSPLMLTLSPISYDELLEHYQSENSTAPLSNLHYVLYVA